MYGPNVDERMSLRGVLRPVGQRVFVRGEALPPPRFPGYQAFWTRSGTAALAQAVLWAVRSSRRKTSAKVILPAYGCPDLVAAVLHAGASPVLIDTRVDDPGFDMGAVAAAMDSTVAAVVAVDFLGIRERHAELRALVDRYGAWLIEDRAQSFPSADTALAGHAVVLSFGRGKPVNLLGGGAVLLRQHLVDEVQAGAAGSLTEPSIERAAFGLHSGFRMRAALFNLLARPMPYGWVVRMPGLGIGATRYRPLRVVEALDEVRLQYLGSNAAAWLSRDRWREVGWEERLRRLSGVVTLPVTLGDRVGRLLRYPILLPNCSTRDGALHDLRRAGLGATELYGSSLPRVRDMPLPVAVQGPFPNAEEFASRLLVLPVHDGVSSEHIEQCVRIIAAGMLTRGSERADAYRSE
jgi:dTDP-4-amino-4,6-dideoxygalactose transaminase